MLFSESDKCVVSSAEAAANSSGPTSEIKGKQRPPSNFRLDRTAEFMMRFPSSCYLLSSGVFLERGRDGALRARL